MSRALTIALAVVAGIAGYFLPLPISGSQGAAQRQAHAVYCETDAHTGPAEPARLWRACQPVRKGNQP